MISTQVQVLQEHAWRKLRAVGSLAQLDDIRVQIKGIQIQHGPRILYGVVWTLNEERKEEWVEEFELTDV